LLYGTHKIGKSTWAASAPNPYFLNIEDGLDDIDCEKSPLLKSYADVISQVSILSTEDHDRQTIVVDTMDWMEKLIHAKVAEAAGKKNLTEIGYGKGYDFAIVEWDFFLRGLNHLRTTRNMGIVLLAHAKITKFQPPEADPYDRYEPDLHKSVCPMIQEWCDEILFANYRTSTVTKDLGFDKTRTRAIGTGERVVYTAEMPTHLAGRRILMPDIIPFDFAAYAAYVVDAMAKRTASNPTPTPPIVSPAVIEKLQETKPPEPSNGNGDIVGIVNDGHSKQKEEIHG
jgi:hypothetical protein